MVQISLPDPVPDGGHTRTPIPVKLGGKRTAYAVFKDGHYEFSVDDKFDDERDKYVIAFEMSDGRPIAVIISRADK